MTRLIRVLAILVLPGAAAAQQDVTHKRDPIEAFGRERHGGVRLDTIARWQEVPASAPVTFEAAVRVMKHHIKVAVEQSDTIARVVYNKRLIASRLAGQPMSKWLRCGSGLTGDYADSWRVTIAYAVFVDTAASAGTSRVGVAFTGSARNPEGVSTSSVACGSTGALENEISSKVREVVQTLQRAP